MSENVFKAVPVADGFYSIEEDFVRSFLVIGKDRAMLVDTGLGTGDIRAFARTLTDLPIFVVITHADWDHVLGNPLFGEVSMHPAEFVFYRSAQKGHGSVRLLPLWEGDVVDLGTRKFEVIHIPGHTPGSVAFLDRENRLLIGGDSIGAGPLYMFDGPRSMEAFLYSMEKLHKITDAFDTVLASHGNLKLSAGLIPDLVEGAKLYLSGKVQGVDPANGMDCLLFDCGKVKFSCPK